MERRKACDVCSLLGFHVEMEGADVEVEPFSSRPVSGGVFGH